MKVLFYATFFWTLTAMGCVTTHEKSSTGTSWKAHTKPPPPVTADQVQQENARTVAQALWDELDRQDQDELLKESAAKPVPPKK